MLQSLNNLCGPSLVSLQFIHIPHTRSLRPGLSIPCVSDQWRGEGSPPQGADNTAPHAGQDTVGLFFCKGPLLAHPSWGHPGPSEATLQICAPATAYCSAWGHSSSHTGLCVCLCWTSWCSWQPISPGPLSGSLTISCTELSLSAPDSFATSPGYDSSLTQFWAATFLPVLFLFKAVLPRLANLGKDAFAWHSDTWSLSGLCWLHSWGESPKAGQGSMVPLQRRRAEHTAHSLV